jgi:transposase InsO family protein
MDVFTRRIIGFGVEPAYIDGVSVCRMFNHAVAGHLLPKRLSTDHDPHFRFHRWLANLRVLEIEEIKSVPYTPVSHPFIEKLIGTIRREFLDRVFFWNVTDLAGSWLNSQAITTHIAYIVRSVARRRRNAPVRHSQRQPDSINTPGGCATHSPFRWRAQLCGSSNLPSPSDIRFPPGAHDFATFP